MTSLSVDEAIRKGHRILTRPLLFIITGVFGGGFILSMLGIFPFNFTFLPLVIGLVATWLYWSIMVTKWKLWAFENVQNVHELKKRAIREQLIWKDNNFLSKTEIWSRSDKEKWDLLQLKFLKEDIFENDLSIPDTTTIYFSRKKSRKDVFGYSITIMIGIGLIIADLLFIGGVFIVAGFISFIKSYRHSKNRLPQIILNKKGIETSLTGFIPWSEISDEEVVSSKGKTSYDYLTFKHYDKKKEIKIGHLDTDLPTLNKLLLLYRGRYGK